MASKSLVLMIAIGEMELVSVLSIRSMWCTDHRSAHYYIQTVQLLLTACVTSTFFFSHENCKLHPRPNRPKMLVALLWCSLLVALATAQCQGGTNRFSVHRLRFMCSPNIYFILKPSVQTGDRIVPLDSCNRNDLLNATGSYKFVCLDGVGWLTSYKESNCSGSYIKSSYLVSDFGWNAVCDGMSCLSNQNGAHVQMQIFVHRQHILRLCDGDWYRFLQCRPCHIVYIGRMPSFLQHRDENHLFRALAVPRNLPFVL